MEYLAQTSSPLTINTSCLIVGIYEHRSLSTPAKQVDEASEGTLKSVLSMGDIQGKQGEMLMLYNLPGIKASRVMLLGLGRRGDLSGKKIAEALGSAVKQLNAASSSSAVFALPYHLTDQSELYALGRDTPVQAEQQIYQSDQCKSEKNPVKKPLARLTLLVIDRKQLSPLKKALSHGLAMANGMTLAKDLANLPGNICTPSYLAREAKKLDKKSDKLKVSVLTEKHMEKLGMGALLSVSRGSREEAKFIVMDYKGTSDSARPVVLVGKGLTFDAGGISIKPSAGMDEMKYDMCGGASVLGTMAACIELELPINLVVLIPSSENLPDGDANKPGDIVTSMAGLTIEILNTDAEGRLILCDALTYAERFKPAAVVDVATLTGACVVALGDHTSGLLANNDKLAAELLEAGDQAGDAAWRLPMSNDYMKQLDSNFADMANIGGAGAGTITAACFLSRFTEKYHWAHLDIAGTAWKKGKDKGATGRPVPLLTQMLLKRCRMAGAPSSLT
jgi:leucyl aminopeptidase